MKVMVVKDRNVLNTKFLAQFVNSLSSIGHEVHVVCDSYRKPGQGVVLDENVTFTNLSARTDNALKNFYIQLRKHLTIPSFRFQKLIQAERPDVIICYFLVDLFNVCFLQKHSVPVIMMNHNYPPVVFDRLKKKSKLRQRIYKELIEEADVLQVLNKSFESTISPYYDVKKIVTIGNAVVQIPPKKRAQLDQPKNKIIYVGRIAKKGKRQHLMIEAFAKVADKFPDWTVEFWGLEKYGSYKQELLDLITKYGLEKNVFIKGYSQNIENEYRNADINAFPSLHEGFGLGLADGMAMGLPSIGFNYTPSVNELIRDGENGYLVSDADEFSEKLELLMSDKELRKKLGAQAAEDMKKFAPEKIIAQWDQLISDTTRAFRTDF
ncbi:glycosyltransferase [Tichowtungia aerotolerans]|uniref:Glycosyltransferase n=1 Tax=Tichowtungia aerotolerans TaxID=2697043 RepID=A0A6P1M1U2_9BACT|nr:glycosyltransferase [Tichowtungia aerotolerans]QHI68082.1 glycosyltransferase [Tichowtungia aerotolerans]